MTMTALVVPVVLNGRSVRLTLRIGSPVLELSTWPSIAPPFLVSDCAPVDAWSGVCCDCCAKAAEISGNPRTRNSVFIKPPKILRYRCHYKTPFTPGTFDEIGPANTSIDDSLELIGSLRH